MCHNNVTIFLKAKTNFLDQRINTMSSSDNNNNNDENDNRMYSENNRLKSFTNWPHNSENISKKEVSKKVFFFFSLNKNSCFFSPTQQQQQRWPNMVSINYMAMIIMMIWFDAYSVTFI